MIDDQSDGSLCFLAQIWFCSVLRNKRSPQGQATEAKYIALANATAEMMWVQKLLDEIGVFNILVQLGFVVITLELPICQQIWYSMLVLSIS